jgi:23S rRNA pseudouridine2605 synthase
MAARLQKILSQWGVASRRRAEELIRARRVTVNGQIAILGDSADPEVDRIAIDGETLQARPQRHYFLLNKPAGVVSTCDDPQGRSTVLDLLPDDLRRGLHPVGRLDTDSTGALLLTNDGQFTCLLTHPRHQISKTYEVWVAGHPSDRVLDRWEAGVDLDGKLTLPAQVKVLSEDQHNTRLQILLREGRNRQIRRVAELLGHPVLKLDRTAIGEILLHLPTHSLPTHSQIKAELPRGQYRMLLATEVKWLSTILNYQIIID